jgi:hypothetical protein
LDYLTTHTSLSPIRLGFAPGFVNYKKRCTRLSAASDKVYQLLAHGRWLFPGTPASSTNKTGRHDIAEILLKVELITINQSINLFRQLMEETLILAKALRPSGYWGYYGFPKCYNYRTGQRNCTRDTMEYNNE